MNRTSAIVCLVLATSLPAQAPVPGSTVVTPDPAPLWNQWRGPDRTGRVTGPAWPPRLNEGNLQRQWRIPLGPSYSGPVVSRDLVFTTATEDGKREVVTAVRRSSGEVVWRTEWEGAMTVPFFALRNGSWIRSTPAFDGESLFVAGMRDLLVCLDAQTGAVRWRVDFVERFKSNLQAFGFVCSPIVDGDSVYVQTGAGLVKLDKATGATRWLALKDQGGMFGGAFSSPARASLAGRDQLLVQTRARLCGVDPASGEVLWNQEIKSFRGMNILTPVAIGDTVFTSAYGGRGHLLAVRREDAAITARPEWTNRVQAYMSSPVVVDSHGYVYLRSKRFCCMDVKTGELRWTSPPIGDEYWSLVANGGRILALTEGGELYLLAASPDSFQVVDRISVAKSETWGHLAVDGGQILIRELDGLTAFTWK